LAPLLLPVGVALNFCPFRLVTRRFANTHRPITCKRSAGLWPLGSYCRPWRLSGPWPLPPWDGSRPDTSNWSLLIRSWRRLGAYAHLLKTWSCATPPRQRWPYQYLEIPVATLVGLIVFWPMPANALAGLGMGITNGRRDFILFLPESRPPQRRLGCSKRLCNVLHGGSRGQPSERGRGGPSQSVMGTCGPVRMCQTPSGDSSSASSGHSTRASLPALRPAIYRHNIACPRRQG